MMKLLWVALYLLSPAVPIALYLADGSFSAADPWSWSIVFGLIAYGWFLNQFIVSARPRVWERLYGLDAMMRFHGVMALGAVLATVAHSSLKFVVDPAPTVQKAIGIVAFLIFFAVTVVTLLFMVKGRLDRIPAVARLRVRTATSQRLQYHRLKRFHNLTAFAAILALAHVMLAFSTRTAPARSGVIILWWVVALAMYLHHKVLRPRRLTGSLYTVAAVVADAPDVTSVILDPPAGSGFDHRAGQFAFFRFRSGGPDGQPSGEEHPFTIASAPGSAQLSFTARHSGDFTGALPGVRPGALVTVEGPYGRFHAEAVPSDRPLVLVAGGIGVTPFLSMVRDLAARQPRSARPIALVWSVRRTEDLVAVDEWERLRAALPGLSISVRVTGTERGAAPVGWTVTHGRLSAGELQTMGLLEGTREYFVCGPQGLTEALVGALAGAGVPKARLHFEAFAL